MKRTTIGGQAVLEGIMMKNYDNYAVAVRKPDHGIDITTGNARSLTQKYKILGLPIIRGVINFAESLQIGMKTLMISTEFVEEDEEETGKIEQFLIDKLGDKLETILMGFTMIVSFALAIGIFMLLPFYLSELMKSYITSRMIRTCLEGVIRVSIFLIYMWAITLNKDMKRVFMYHGAEHKTINCLEHGEDLTVENIRKHTRLHKRCGTSFMLIVMIVSIIVFMFISVDQPVLKMLLRVLLVPVIAGIAYEFIRLAGRSESKLVGLLSKPGLCLQYLTTKEPEDDMIEIAVAAVEAVFDWREYLEAMRNGELED